MNEVRWLLVGAGDIAKKRVAPALAGISGSRLAAVCDPRVGEADQLAGQYGVECRYRDLETALAHAPVDAVYLATPVWLHAEGAVQALAAGKHVLIEKPLALSAAEAGRVVAAADASGKHAACAYFRRFSPRYEGLRDMLANGEFGRVIAMQMTYQSWFSPAPDDPKYWRVVREKSGGGPLSDMGTHMFDVLIGLFGMPVRVFVRCANLTTSWDVEDAAAVTLTMPDGALVTASFNWNSKTWRHEFDVVGTEARVTWLPYDSGPVIKTVGPRADGAASAQPGERTLAADRRFRHRYPRRPPAALSPRSIGEDERAAGRDLPIGGRGPGDRVMRFSPKPENDFAEFIRVYYRECRARCPQIEAVAGKWMFRDLIPGMSDFDSRFICRDGMTADDWCAMSVAVGETHLAMCREYASWIRNLEHLPGVNLTWRELTSDALYYPETRQWTYYDATQPAKLAEALAALRAKGWGARDELFHLKKFCLYYGRYDRQIDPGCNMFPHEAKYPMHSRVMHYFAPPVQSAMSVLERRNVVGKFEALERAAATFPELGCWEVIDELLAADYALERWYAEPHLSHFEDLLEMALQVMASALRDAITLVPLSAGLDITKWKAVLAGVPVDPAYIVFENAKFSRLMKGRLRFYADAPAYFDTQWLLENELGRIHNNFFRNPFRAFWKAYAGEDAADPFDILDRLGSLLTVEEIADTRAFAQLTAPPLQPENWKALAREVAEVYDGFYHALHRISDELLKEKIG